MGCVSRRVDLSPRQSLRVGFNGPSPAPWCFNPSIAAIVLAGRPAHSDPCPGIRPTQQWELRHLSSPDSTRIDLCQARGGGGLGAVKEDPGATRLRLVPAAYQPPQPMPITTTHTRIVVGKSISAKKSAAQNMTLLRMSPSQSITLPNRASVPLIPPPPEAPRHPKR